MASQPFGDKQQAMRRALFLPSVLTLAACASSQGDYPSLALRDAERGVRTPSTAGLALPDPAPPSPQVLTQIVAAVEAAQGAHARFLAALPAARGAVSTGGRAAVDSTAYAAALIALGNLQSISSGTAFALADLDALLAARSNDLRTTQAVADAQARVAALLEEETTAIAALERAVR